MDPRRRLIDFLREDPRVDDKLEIGGRCLPIHLIRHRTARRLTLRLAPDGSAVRVTLPVWCSAGQARAFARARQTWLAEQLAKIPPARDPVAEGRFQFRGAEVAIAWSPDRPRAGRLEGDRFEVGGPEDAVGKRVRNWLEKTALDLFRDDAGHYCRAIGREPVDVRLSRAGRRWGSCSSKGVLRINWRLVQAPDFVRRSVVAHEVAHLVHFDHSPQFHALLDRLYEGDVAAADAWLRAHGRALHASFG